MDGATHVSTSQERKCVAGVDGEGGVQRLDVLPFARRVVLDLQSSDGLTEEEGPRPEV